MINAESLAIHLVAMNAKISIRKGNVNLMAIWSKVTLWALVFAALSGTLSAASVTVDFEGISDLTAVNNIYAGSGITFSGGSVYVSGAFGGSLNESEFPPRSGIGVFLNDANTTSILFASPINSFQGFFTYGGPLTLNFYDSGNTLLTSILSGFSANLALSGDIGSLPNEELLAAMLANATRLEILAPNADFTLDDLTINTSDVSSVPEPASFALAAAGIAWMAWRQRTRP